MKIGAIYARSDMTGGLKGQHRSQGTSDEHSVVRLAQLPEASRARDPRLGRRLLIAVGFATGLLFALAVSAVTVAKANFESSTTAANSAVADTLSPPTELSATGGAGYLSELVRDGDTIQVGAGAITNAVVHAGTFDGKRDLGWHSEATIGGIIDLMREGVINGARKSVDPGIAVATGYAGGPEHMEYVRLNPFRVIASQDNMVAINVAMLVDLTGQIAADSLGHEMIGGTGGQLEFAVGALNAKNGRSITVLKSTALGREASSIVDTLPAGTVVTVPRLFADTVVTEFGIALLWGRTVRERALELIGIAHPRFREALQTKAQQLWGE
jgi:hypothetical protein